MKESLILEGKNYISAKRAAKVINYAQDYIGQLCRRGKLDCRMIGRSWYVTEESLLAHRESAVDATQERVSKIVEKNEIKVEETKIEDAIENKVEEKIAQENTFKYEPEQGHQLPALLKKVPSHFSLPNTLSNIQSLPKSLSQNFTKTIPKFAGQSFIESRSHSPAAIFLLTLTIAVTGFIFMNSLSTYTHQNAYPGSMASAASIAKSIADRIFGSFAAIGKFFVRNETLLGGEKNNLATNQSTVNQNISESQNFNGIGVAPSANSTSTDEVTKAKIKNSFSDEVAIHPDRSGTAGVITPVFKKTNGEDFVYVLVPVKEKHQ